MLTRRASLVADQDASARTQAGTLRNEVLALLQRFRTTLADEFADQPNIARERDREIFAFIDQLAGDRQTALRSRVVADRPGPVVAPSELVTEPANADANAVLPR